MVAAELWRQVQEDYTNTALHEEFLNCCIQTKQFEFAASCYREYLLLHPEDTTAKEMQNLLTEKMFTLMRAQRSVGLANNKTAPVKDPAQYGPLLKSFAINAFYLALVFGVLFLIKTAFRHSMH